MSARLFLVRHGQSIWNAERRLQGQADPPLSALGIQQAAALAEAFCGRPLAAIYTSPLARAQATAATIGAPHGLRPCAVEALREVHLGARQGRDIATLDLAAGESDGAGAQADGESLHAALARVAPAVEAIVARHTDATVVLVLHSILGRVLLSHLLGTGLALVPRLKLKQASITLLRLDGGSAVLERLGDTGHLRPSPDPVVEGAWR